MFAIHLDLKSLWIVFSTEGNLPGQKDLTKVHILFPLAYSSFSQNSTEAETDLCMSWQLAKFLAPSPIPEKRTNKNFWTKPLKASKALAPIRLLVNTDLGFKPPNHSPTTELQTTSNLELIKPQKNSEIPIKRLHNTFDSILQREKITQKRTSTISRETKEE